jgi:type I restriction enzyme S subunit
MARFRWSTSIFDANNIDYENIFDIQGRPLEWERRTLHSLAELRTKHFMPKDEYARPYIGLEHIEEGTLTLKSVGNSEEVISSKYVFKKGDILFGKLRPYFRKVILAPFDGVCSTDILVIKTKEGTYNKYLFYLIASKQIIDSVTTASEGTKMPRASWGFLKNIAINTPPFEEQIRIGDIISFFDELVKCKARQNEILENIAMAVLDNWFKGFELAKAEELGNSRDEKVPDGWKITSLYDVAEWVNGYPFAQETLNTEGRGRPVIKITELENGITDSTQYYEGEIDPIYLLKQGDLLFAWSASVEVYIWCLRDAVLNQHIFRVFPKIDKSYLYFLLQKLNFLFQRIAENKATTMGHVTVEDMKRIKVCVPGQNMRFRITEILDPLFRKLMLNLREIMFLRATRDTLLPLLVFGKLRVEEI